MSYEQRKRTWARLQMWQDLRETQRNEPVHLDMNRWRHWLNGVTEYSSVHATCVWNGLDVFIDAEAPYVTVPNPDFPIERDVDGLRMYLAWPVSTECTPNVGEATFNVEAGL